jgi:DNA topoisomerase-1
VTTDAVCPDCGKKLAVRFGRKGPFLGCSGFPKCRHTRNLTPEEKARYLPADGADEAEGSAEDGGQAPPASTSS